MFVSSEQRMLETWFKAKNMQFQIIFDAANTFYECTGFDA